jgi:hypothetical protein
MRRQLHRLAAFFEAREPRSELEFIGEVTLFVVVLFASLVVLAWRGGRW